MSGLRAISTCVEVRFLLETSTSSANRASVRPISPVLAVAYIAALYDSRFGLQWVCMSWIKATARCPNSGIVDDDLSKHFSTRLYVSIVGLTASSWPESYIALISLRRLSARSPTTLEVGAIANDSNTILNAREFGFTNSFPWENSWHILRNIASALSPSPLQALIALQNISVKAVLRSSLLMTFSHCSVSTILRTLQRRASARCPAWGKLDAAHAWIVKPYAFKDGISSMVPNI